MSAAPSLQAAAAGAGLSRNQLRAAAPLVPVGTQATPMQPGAFDLDAVEARGRHLGYMSNEGPVKVLESPVWALRRNATWMQPPRMCPGKPSAVGLDVGAPPEAVRAEMMRMIDLMVEGQCVVESGEHRALVEDRCVFLTRDCAALNLTYGGHSVTSPAPSPPPPTPQSLPWGLSVCVACARGCSSLEGYCFLDPLSD